MDKIQTVSPDRHLLTGSRQTICAGALKRHSPNLVPPEKRKKFQWDKNQDEQQAGMSATWIFDI
jgi:hypothetical protein